MLAEVLAQIPALLPQLVATRRDFALHPELSDEEQRTARVVAERLHALGLMVQTGVGGHGIVALLSGARPGPTVALRCELDAMPIHDALETPYRSLHLGIKHACGHDAHLAMALGVAELLTAARERLPGTVKLIFQPAEESLAGAQAMIAAGALENQSRARALLAAPHARL